MRTQHVRSRRRNPTNKVNSWHELVGWPVLAILALAFAFGGGGSRYGFLNLSVQLAALATLVWCSTEVVRRWKAHQLSLKLLVALTLLLPLVQLVPLPPSVWHALPGGELTLAARNLAGAANDWFPLTVDPQRTIIAFAALIPAFAILFVISTQIGAAQVILRVIIGFALLNFLVGTIQVISGQNHLLPYPIIEPGRLYGLFASHNSSGLFFVIALCALFGLRFGKSEDLQFRIMIGTLSLVFILGAFLTQSRSSIALLLLPLGAFMFRFVTAYRHRDTTGKSKSLSWPIVGAAALAGLTAIAFAVTNERLLGAFMRFGTIEDKRPLIWEDSWIAFKTFFPFGSGMGSFDEIFQNFESLEHVSRGYARRAHNDFLELGIEAGIFGLALVVAWTAWIASAWRKGRDGEEGREVDASALALLAIAAQSVLDYPLRNQTVLCLAAVLVAVLAARATRLRDGVIEKN